MSRLAMIAMTVLLLGTGLSMPAQAQSPGFGVFFGDQESDFYAPERFSCMNDRQIRDAVADLGYTNISLNVVMKRNIQVRATRDGVVYLLDFNICTGRVEGRQQLRRAP
ncbi:hypothetical protein [Devosia psychrophila]|uniref:Peptidase propeptide and YPEB domain-containing protein n=2 Tax=Devosia psychrophila TaxID=728005 RepID=A0A1I1KQJ5_9HYPH|nr:hypothetical protein [Devosia psychrophila]SFC63096.1 hypothetical protein SAMN04488059_10810 [Devosia psychrophila]